MHQNKKTPSLTECRAEIDRIDCELVKLFCARMQIVSDVAAYKKANQMPVYDEARERALLSKVCAMADPDMKEDVRALYESILSLSKGYQNKLL